MGNAVKDFRLEIHWFSNRDLSGASHRFSSLLSPGRGYSDLSGLNQPPTHVRGYNMSSRWD